jgi:heme/copper-type cytochrome/quinol oxidase subunit 2
VKSCSNGYRRTLSRWMVRGCCCLLVLLVAVVGEACPNCKDALAGDPAQAGMVRGYFWSILFMMSMPFTILLALGTYFYLQWRSARQAGWGDDVRAMVAASERAESPFGESY